MKENEENEQNEENKKEEIKEEEEEEKLKEKKILEQTDWVLCFKRSLFEVHIKYKSYPNKKLFFEINLLFLLIHCFILILGGLSALVQGYLLMDYTTNYFKYSMNLLKDLGFNETFDFNNLSQLVQYNKDSSKKDFENENVFYVPPGDFPDFYDSKKLVFLKGTILKSIECSINSYLSFNCSDDPNKNITDDYLNYTVSSQCRVDVKLINEYYENKEGLELKSKEESENLDSSYEFFSQNYSLPVLLLNESFYIDHLIGGEACDEYNEYLYPINMSTYIPSSIKDYSELIDIAEDYIKQKNENAFLCEDGLLRLKVLKLDKFIVYDTHILPRLDLCKNLSQILPDKFYKALKRTLNITYYKILQEKISPESLLKETSILSTTAGVESKKFSFSFIVLGISEIISGCILFLLHFEMAYDNYTFIVSLFECLSNVSSFSIVTFWLSLALKSSFKFIIYTSWLQIVKYLTIILNCFAILFNIYTMYITRGNDYFGAYMKYKKDLEILRKKKEE